MENAGISITMAVEGEHLLVTIPKAAKTPIKTALNSSEYHNR